MSRPPLFSTGARSPWPQLRSWLGLAFTALAISLFGGATVARAQAPAKVATRADASGQEAERQAKDKEELKVKADLLHSFLKYSKFPEGTFAHAKSPIVLLVIGDDPFGPLLKQTFAKKRIGGRTVQIRRLKRIPGRICAHLVFAHGLNEKDRAALIQKLCTRPCLLVSDVPGFAEAGGFINLYQDEGKVRFEINGDCLKTTGVQLKAEFLKLARIVSKRPAPAPKKGRAR